MAMNAIELRNALMFDISTDSELCALESNCDLADYVLESAMTTLSITMEADEVIDAEFKEVEDAPQVEAAKKNAGQKLAAWWEKLKAGVTKFVQGALQVMKSVMLKIRQLGNVIRKKQAEATAKKLGKIEAAAEVSASVLRFMSEADSAPDLAKFVLDNAKKAAQGEEVEVKPLMPEIEDDENTVEVGVADATKYLNNAAKKLGELNKSLASVGAVVKEVGKDAAKGHTAACRATINKSYDEAMKLARGYFQRAMSIAKALKVKAAADKKDAKKAEKEAKKAEK